MGLTELLERDDGGNCSISKRIIALFKSKFPNDVIYARILQRAPESRLFPFEEKASNKMTNYGKS